MLVEGHVIGNINVERLSLKGEAFVHGDITCKSIAVESRVKMVGRVNIHPMAPKEINSDGNDVTTSNINTIQVLKYINIF